MRRQLLASLLALLLLSPAGLAWLATAWQKQAVKQAVKAQLHAGMDASELVVLAFAKQDAQRLLEWEHEREFEYRGQMYDLAKTETRGDSIFYTCYWDRAETELNHKLDRCIADWLQQSPQQQERSERLAFFFRSLYHAPTLSYITSSIPFHRPVFHYLTSTSRLGNPPLSPPPKFFNSILSR